MEAEIGRQVFVLIVDFLPSSTDTNLPVIFGCVVILVLSAFTEHTGKRKYLGTYEQDLSRQSPLML